MMVNGNTSQSPPGHVLPYDNIVSVSVGDFDGSGVSEIAVSAINYQPAQDNKPDTTLSVQTLRYRSELQTIFEIGLSSLSPPPIQEGSNSQQPAFLGADLTMTSGDYEGRNADDVALGYIAYGPPLQSNQTHEVYPTSVIHLLSSPTQFKAVVQATLQASNHPGEPSTLTLAGIPAGSIPQQLTISTATNCSTTTTNCNNTWGALNGTWQTTFTYSPNAAGQFSFSIPADTSGLQTGSGQITFYMSMPLGPAQGNTPLQNALPEFNNSSPDDYPKLQLVSGLFQYDPTNGWDFSRRQLAAVWNNPRCCNPTTYTINAAWYSVSGPPNPPQFSQGGAVALESQNGPEAAQFFTVTAGAFRGNTILQTPPTPDLAPVWSLAINAWYTNSQDVVRILEPDGNGSFNVSEQSFAVSQVDRQARLAVVNYDADGSSVYLGAPIHLSMSNLVTPTAIIKEPPKHLAWLNGGIFNLNRTETFNVQLQTSASVQSQTTTQETNGSDFSSSNSISASASVDTTVFPGISNKLSVSDTQSLSYSKSQTDSTYYQTQGEVQYDAGATADLDDLVEAQIQNLDVWRYRVYSASGNASSPPTFYDLTYPSLPTNTTPNITAGGQSNDWYNPVHENGNLLSYSPLPSSQLPDDYSQSPYLVNNQKASGVTNGVLFSGHAYCYSGVSGTQTITMNGVATTTDTVDTSKTNSWDQDMEVGDTVKVEGSELSTSVDADLGQNQSLSQSTASENTTSGSTGLSFNVDAGNPEQSYNIFPIFYNSTGGVLKFVYYISIPTAASSNGTCGSGGYWWTDNYGGAPDPALNLPFRFSSSLNPTTNVLTWNLNRDLTREQLRSFFLTSATENTIETTSPDNPVYTPLATNPAEGSEVRMAVRVYNFSLNPQNAENVAVQFSAMPYDSGTDNELGCGTPSSGETGRYCAPNARTVLGTTTLASIPYWGSSSGSNWAMAAFPWTIPAGFIASNQNATEFRIYVNLTYSGNELNPPQAPCNNSSASNPAPCPGPIGATSSDPNWDPNAPGQNNEGWSYITLQPASGSSTSSELTRQNVKVTNNLSAALNGEPQHPSPAHNLKARPDSLAAVDPAGKLKSGLVVAYLGRRLHVRVKAYSEVNDIQELQKALVHDGSGPRKKVIAVKALRGVSFKGTSAWFHWTPTTPGLHQLTAELLEPQDDLTKGDNKARLSVIVVRAPGDVNGDGSVDGLDTAFSVCSADGEGCMGKRDGAPCTAHQCR